MTWLVLLAAIVAAIVAVSPFVDLGTYRWVDDDYRGGPAPLFHLVVRPPRCGWARVELGILGRALWISWRDSAP